jgi:hypothetical protein
VSPRALALVFARCDICGEPRRELVQGTRCLECYGLAPEGVEAAGNYTQAQAQAQAQGEDKAQTPSLGAPPEPGCNSDGGPELRRLMELHRDGQLEPVDVRLGEMPPHAGTVMRNIADHWRLLMGLRRQVGDGRPLPYARSMAVNAGLANDLGTASNAINALVRAGVVEHVGSLPPTRPGLDGTKLYAPPTGGAS